MMNIYLASLIFSIMMLFFKHPLSVTFILIIQSTLIATSTGSLNYDYWFSYILFMIMVGGMLVVLIYMTSIASNEKFKLMKTWLMIPIILMIPSFESFINQNLMDMMTYKITENLFSLEKFYSWPSSMLIIMMIIYLLIALIAVVKISDSSKGPLRQTK